MSNTPRARRLMPRTRRLTDLDPDQYVTPEEAAAHLAVKVRTVYALHAKGALPGTRVMRYLRFKARDVVHFPPSSLTP